MILVSPLEPTPAVQEPQPQILWPCQSPSGKEAGGSDSRKCRHLETEGAQRDSEREIFSTGTCFLPNHVFILWKTRFFPVGRPGWLPLLSACQLVISKNEWPWGCTRERRWACAAPSRGEMGVSEDRAHKCQPGWGSRGAAEWREKWS